MMEPPKKIAGNALILAMVKISYPFLALTEIDLKQCYDMAGPTSFCCKFAQQKTCFLQNGTVQKGKNVTK